MPADQPAVPADQPAADQPPRVEYRAGAESGPGARHGRFALTLDAAGAARLEHRQAGVVRRWSARVEAVVWPRLVAAGRAAGAPGIEPTPGALAILDAVVHQVSNGTVRGTTGNLPWVTRRVTAEPGAHSAPVPMPVAAFGTLDGVAVGGIAGTDGGVTVFRVADGPPGVGDGPPGVVARLAPTGSSPRAVAFTGDAVVTGGDDGVLRVWAPDGTPVSAQVRHAAPVAALTSTVDDATLVVWSADLAGRVVERGLRPGAPAATHPPLPAGVTALAWARAASYEALVTGADDGRVRIHPVDGAGAARDLTAHDGWVNAVAVIGAGEDFLVASGGADRVIRLGTGVAGTGLPALAGHAASVTGVAFGLIGERLVLGSCALDGTARTWDVHTREVIAEWPAGDDWPAALVDVAAGGVQRWATGGADGVVRVWDAATGEPTLTLVPDGAPGAVLALASALLPGGTLVAAGYLDGSFRVWDAADGTPVGVDRSSAEPLLSVEFGRDRELDVFVCGTAAGSVRVYDPATAAFRHVLTPHTDQVLSLATAAVAPAGRFVVSGGADHTVRVWDARTGWPLLCLDGHRDLVTAVAVGAVEGRAVLASAGYDRTVRTWDAETGAPRFVLDGPASPVYHLAFGTAAGRPVLAAAGYGDAVRVWDAATGEPVRTTPPVAGFVTALALGTWSGHEVAVAAADDGTVRCWALPDGKPLWTTHHTPAPLALRLAPTGGLHALHVGGPTSVDLATVREDGGRPTSTQPSGERWRAP